MTSLHNQIPTSTLSEADYETVLLRLGEQLTASCRAEGYPEDAAPRSARDALTIEFGTADDQTILDWLTAAGRRLTVSTAGCAGI